MADNFARFLDGKTSKPRDVQIALTDQHVLIYEGQELVVKWPYSAVFVKEDWSDGVGGLYGFKDSGDAGLMVFNVRLYRDIQRRLSRRDKASFIIPTKVRYLFLMAGVAVASGFLLFPVVTHLASMAVFLVPQSLEDKLGDMAAREMERNYKSCDDKIAQKSLQTIIDRLVVDKNLRPVITLYKTNDQNAFTLPGRRMAILTGFLKNARNENEIAAVLAHEMGHMAKRDPLESVIESQGIGLLMSMVGSSGAYGDVAKAVSVIQMLSYSRDKEFAADAYGADLLKKSGYSPEGMSQFLSRMQKAEKGELAKIATQFEFLSTHPDTVERVKRLRAMTVSQHYKASLSNAEFLRLREACIK